MNSIHENPQALERYRTAKAYFSNGEFFRSYDLARDCLETWPQYIAFAHLAVLSLADAGAIDAALDKFTLFGLDQVQNIEARSLLARLKKDLGFATTGTERRTLHTEARAIYEETYAHATNPEDAYYPGINAAALAVWCGDLTGAHRLAAEVLAILKTLEAADPEADRYWRKATEAEASLILGRMAGVPLLLLSMRQLSAGRNAQIASTIRQLRRLAHALALPQDFLDTLTLPAVIHFVGHIIAPPGKTGRFMADEEFAARIRIESLFASENIGTGYGSLAAGADILFAEALLARKAALHVILPFAIADFIEFSVAPAGEVWITRFHACLAAAQSVRYATEDRFLHHDRLFQYASQLAMGLAVLAARHMQSPVLQCALWDGVANSGVAGTVADMKTWRRTKHAQRIVRCGTRPQQDELDLPEAPPPSQPEDHTQTRSFSPMMLKTPSREQPVDHTQTRSFSPMMVQTPKRDQPLNQLSDQPLDHTQTRSFSPRMLQTPQPVNSQTSPPDQPSGVIREVRAMLFGDLHGFSKLTDCELPLFAANVMGPLSEVVRSFRDRTAFINTWGDGIFVVLEDVSHAADWALTLQERMKTIDLAAAGLPAGLQLRLGGHLGPVYQLMDPILERINFYGSHVSRAARIEPVTPEGCIYVTETFAAVLALNDSEHFACDYAGYTEMAKHYGRLRIFLLRRVQGESSPAVLGDIERPPLHT